MAIEWDSLIIEMVTLAAIIYGSVYLASWIEKKKIRNEQREDAKKIIRFVTNDLNKRLQFIEESIQYKDFKPFFTDLWDAIILGGKQTLLPFEMFENLQHTYSWMKYYNNELEQWEKSDGEAAILEILNEVSGSIKQSRKILGESKL